MHALTAIVGWSLRNRALVLAATLLFVAAGARAALQLPIDAVPDATNIQVQVITTAPALSPVEVEQYISVPVERAMSGLPRVTQIRSLSKYGLSVVTVVFDDEIDIYFARQLVNERMREASDAVPAAYGRPEMGPISTGLGEIYQFTLRSETHSLMELEELLHWYIGPQLRTVPGVVELNSFGGENREYQVVLHPERLQAMRLSIDQVAEALGRSNANAGGGYVERNGEQVVIGSNGLVRRREDLERVVLGSTPQGTPITVSEVGEVRFGPKLRRGAATQDGEGEVVVAVTLMLMGENSRTVTRGIKEKLAALAPSLPEGMRIEPFYDRTRLVERTIHTVATNLAEGAALVLLLLFLVLGDLRAGLVVATTIPLAMLFAVIVMNSAGLSGNLMSLGAIDFGLIVDGAVIVVENAARRLGEASRRAGAHLSEEQRIAVIQESTVEVRGAAVFGEMIIAIVYLPILALTGMEGKLFHPMAYTVLLALAGAFIFSLTLVPVLTSYLVRPPPDARETLLLRAVHRVYTPMLHAVLRRRRLTITVGVLVLVAGAALFGRLGAQFVPQLDEGDLLLEARRLPGTALSTSVTTNGRIERALREIPEIVHVVSRTGSPQIATDPMGVESSDVYVQLKERDAWRPGLTKDDIAAQMSALVEMAVPEVSGAITQPIQMRTNELVAGIRSDAGVVIYGPDLAALRTLGESVLDRVKGVTGVVDARVEQLQGLQYLRIDPDRNRLARYGLTIADISLATEAIAVGHKVGEVLEGERRFDIMVKFECPITGDLDTLSALPLRGNQGQLVPLGDVASLQHLTGPVLVNRDQQSRRVIVEFNVRGRDLVSTVEAVQAALAGGLTLPVGYRLGYGGSFEQYIAARNRLAMVVPLALALILFMLWTALRSIRSAAIIFLGVPFAVVGGVIALWLRDLPFSISAGVGFIALFGVAVLNGLVLVTFAQRLQADGANRVAAIAQAAELRLRPVLTTALVAALGFVPMALSTAPGSEVQRPLATVVIGGLVSAMLLTLLVLPAVYARFGPSASAGINARAPS
ncbi:efflux RND transporter permease subunit [Nannocystis bainbridge]|uniref:CusA/CzcA family heavy metal efflux RND transporter n=1 Tax=Nannocystis bainbridge TaxID=2995303 RepID=A0ABT5E7T7_9BACT|nr:CusA/CzcA family heavy metal efflux RND transporter [Nannocystis bainbridge]MDC0720841.1 CusA/CzcA family heavy metal efflux RND transporter [Nannocystis bainbridge]